MAETLNKFLSFVGWESPEDIEEIDEMEPESSKPQFLTTTKSRQQKVVNIHSNAQFKMVILHPQSFNDAQEICDHLKSKKPVVVNLERVEKDVAQRIVDFLSGSVYALDGSIQKVANGIFLIAPVNVDIMGDFKEELQNKGAFPWVK